MIVILAEENEDPSGRPTAAGVTSLISFRWDIRDSLTSRLTNLQTIGFGFPALFLCGTRWAVSISWIDIFSPISLNNFTQSLLVVEAASSEHTSGTPTILTLYWKLYSWNSSMALAMASTLALTCESCELSRCSSLLAVVLKRRKSSYSLLRNSRLWDFSLAEGAALLLCCWINFF